MSNINETKNVPSNNVVEIDQLENGIITHQPSRTSGQINTQTIQNFHQNPSSSGHFYQNGQMVPVLYINHGINGIYPVRTNTAQSKDYANLIWSICNSLCCLWPVGIIALVISIITLRKRRQGDQQNIRCCTTSAIILNGIATIGGIIIISLYSTGNIRLS